MLQHFPWWNIKRLTHCGKLSWQKKIAFILLITAILTLFAFLFHDICDSTVTIYPFSNKEKNRPFNENKISELTSHPEIKLVTISAGSFYMGSSPEESGRKKMHHKMTSNSIVPYSDEKLHKVVISRPFQISATEVTQGLWKTIMGTNPSNFSLCGDNCPVEQISWFESLIFCNNLSRMENLEVCYQIKENAVSWDLYCNGYRLPTEAEWEYSARAGSISSFYSGACLSTDQANFDGNYPLKDCPKGNWQGQSIPVASYEPNPWGLFDMHGNVSEWVWDWMASYEKDVGIDPVGPHRGLWRGYRGGSWLDYDRQCRSAFRDGNDPIDLDDDLGFRVARSIFPKQPSKTKGKENRLFVSMLLKSNQPKPLKPVIKNKIPVRMWHILFPASNGEKSYHGHVSSFSRFVFGTVRNPQTDMEYSDQFLVEQFDFRPRAKMVHFATSGKMDNLEFSFITDPPESQVNFYLFINSISNPARVSLGKPEKHPAVIPFSLSGDLPRVTSIPPEGGYLIWNTEEHVNKNIFNGFEIE